MLKLSLILQTNASDAVTSILQELFAAIKEIFQSSAIAIIALLSYVSDSILNDLLFHNIC